MVAEDEISLGRQLKCGRADLFSRNSVAISGNPTLVPLKDGCFYISCPLNSGKLDWGKKGRVNFG